MATLRRHTVRDSLRASVRDGLFWSVMAGFVEAYLVPCALFLRASNMDIGFLRSVPHLAAAVSQVKAADFVEWVGSRRTVFAACALTQAVCLFGAVASVWLGGERALWPFIALATAYIFAGMLGGPPWVSLMGEYLPARKRGAYMGWRNRLLGVSLTGFGFLAGVLLSFFGKERATGFLILFSIAGLARLVSWRYLLAMYEPPRKPAAHQAFSYLQFLGKLPSSNFARFTICCSAFVFGVHLAAPYFAVYMLKELGFGYLTYTIVITAGTLSLYLFMHRWGKWVDALGGVQVMRAGAFFISLIPVLWCFTRKPWLFCVIEIFSGAAWAAYTMGTGNFLFDAVSPAKRTRCAAYFAGTTGAAQCAGALLGGYLYDVMPAVKGGPFIPLLLLSASVRLISAVFLARGVREVREVPRVEPRHLMMAVIGFRPLFYR